MTTGHFRKNNDPLKLSSTATQPLRLSNPNFDFSKHTSQVSLKHLLFSDKYANFCHFYSQFSYRKAKECTY